MIVQQLPRRGALCLLAALAVVILAGCASTKTVTAPPPAPQTMQQLTEVPTAEGSASPFVFDTPSNPTSTDNSPAVQTSQPSPSSVLAGPGLPPEVPGSFSAQPAPEQRLTPRSSGASKPVASDSAPPPAPTGGYRPNLSGPNGLITNEYAFFNGGGVQSADWEMTSGSLFRKDNTGWTGVPDGAEPNATSSNGNNSAIFRATTKRTDFTNFATTFAMKINALTSTGATPPVAWDGVHIFLRYQSEQYLYYATVNRRDGAVVVKKKCPGGDSNGGTYYTLGEKSGVPIQYQRWVNVGADIRTNSNGSVTITLSHGGRRVLQATDNGIGCGVIRGAGATGIRADNADMQFRDFVVRSH